MTKTKQIPHGGSSSHRPGGMVTARFTGAEKEAERQFADTPGEETEDSQEWPRYSEEETGTSKSTGKAGDQPQQAEGGAEAPPKENTPPPPDPQLGMSKDPTNTPATDPTQDSTQDPTVAKPEEAEEEAPPELTAYVKSYKEAGKN